jgi:hypothetical protein
MSRRYLVSWFWALIAIAIDPLVRDKRRLLFLLSMVPMSVH